MKRIKKKQQASFKLVRTIVISIITLTVFALSACHDNTNHGGSTIPLRYASFLRMYQHQGYIIANVIDPWDTTKTLHQYILVDRNRQLPSPLPEGTVVRTPLHRTIVYSSVHCSLLTELGKINSIVGVCDLKYVILPAIHQRNADGLLKDLGNSMIPDAEQMIGLNPDAILLSPYKDNGGYGKLDKSGIPLIECADYMETSPLGRAEWMKFYGLLYGCRQQADSLFEKIVQDYSTYKKMASKTSRRPTVFADMKNGSTWMVPGGNSTVGIFLRDASTRYLFADKTESGSITISPEEVLNTCHNAEFWIIKYNNGSTINYQSLVKLDPVYRQFSAVQHHKVYGCNTGIVPFYEDAPFHPERLLKDLIHIFHPELLKNYKTKYYQAL